MSSSDNSQFDPQSVANELQSKSAVPPKIPPVIEAPVEFQTAPIPVPSAPIENPPWNGWDVCAIVGLAFLTILISQFAILLGAHFFVYPHAPLAALAQKPLLLLVSQFIIDGIVALLLFLLVESKYHVRFWQAIQWNWPAHVWKWLGWGVGTFLVLSVLENILPMPKDTPFEKLFARPRDAYLVAILAVTIGPLIEELFFRGFFYPVLARRWGVSWGVFLTALPFALMHMPQYGYAWGAILVIFVVGVVCGIVRAVTKSVGTGFLVHAGYNGTQMLIAFFLTRGFTHMPQGMIRL